MSSTGQYQGSQAFNNIDVTRIESVNPNTGSLSFIRTIAELKGVRASIDVKLNLFYSAGFRGTFGLPRNWGLDLPYVLYGKSLTFQGRTFPVDSAWKDEDNHQSGLRYANNHGIKFRQEPAPRKLPSGLGKYGFKLDHPDGSIDFFDVLGKPIEHHDVYGNFLHYNYVTGDQLGPDSPELRLGWIQDSYGQKLKFSYQQGVEMRITQPDDGKTIVRFSENGVDAIIDAEGRKIRLEYAPFNNSQLLLSKISYPTGLVSRYDYSPIQYLDLDGKAGYMPAVGDHRQLDAEKKVYSRTKYIFGESSNQTYTGAAISCKLGGLTDLLMEEGSWSYKYDVTTVKLDESGRTIAKSRTWFNNLHLATETIQYSLDDQSKTSEAFMTQLTYAGDQEKRARITTYNLPTEVQSSRNISNGPEPQWEVMSRSETKYNSYTNPELSVEFVGNVKQRSVQIEYIISEYGLQLPATVIKIDEVSGAMHKERHTPSNGGRSIGSTSTYFSPNSKDESQLRPHKDTNFSFDDKGRQVSTTTAWGKGAPVPEHTVASATRTTSYAYEDSILSRTETDALGNSTTFHHDIRQASGPVIRKLLPAGEAETFEYDRIGRQVKHIDAIGNRNIILYTDSGSGTSQMGISPLGYRTLTSFDVLGREFQTSDNGDSTKPMTDQTTRVLSRKKYNALNLVQESTDRLGLTTTSSYDSLSRPLATTDPLGNITTYQYKKGGLEVLESLNGDLRTLTEFDPKTRPIRQIKFPDSENNSTSFSLQQDITYNGEGKVTRNALGQRPKHASLDSPASQIETEEVTYGPNQVVATQTTVGYTENGRDTGPVYATDANNRRVLFRNQQGQKETFNYNANGWLARTTRFDGTETLHQYDSLGRVVAIKTPSSVKEMIYDADGRQVETREGPDTVKHTFALDGTAMSVTYAGSQSQTFSLDQFSRVVKKTDVFGTQKSIEYNALGQVSRLSCQNDTLIYIYGTVNHKKEEVIGQNMRGTRNYNQKLAYGGFGRLKQENVTDSSSATILETIYTYDARDKVIAMKSSSSIYPEHNNSRAFMYDGIGQLVQEKHEASSSSESLIMSYSYDGNSNVLSATIDGKESHMSYNSIDQRTDSGFVYDTNGRLVRDDENHEYTFDDRDRLIAVSAPSTSPTSFAYRSNDELKERHESGVEDAEYYHDSNRINAVHALRKQDSSQDVRVSLFSDASSLLSGYSNGNLDGHVFQQLGSSVLVLGAEKHSSTSYTAYGANKTSAPHPADVLSRFGFTQAFTDYANGLIHLGSRFYRPKQFGFLSPDSVLTENRYAYCEGDPVNRIDPTGHSWQDWLGNGLVQTIVGTAVAIGVIAAFTFGTGGLATAFAGAMGGMVSNLVVTAMQHGAGQRDASAGDYAVEAAVGFVTGGISAGVGFKAKDLAQASFVKAVAYGSIFTAGVEATKSTIVQAAHGEGVSFGRVAGAFGMGLVKGVAQGYRARRTWLWNNGALHNERIWGRNAADMINPFDSFREL